MKILSSSRVGGVETGRYVLEVGRVPLHQDVLIQAGAVDVGGLERIVPVPCSMTDQPSRYQRVVTAL